MAGYPEIAGQVPGDAADGVVIVLGCGMRRYREYLLSAAATRRPLWFFNPEPPSWQTDYIVGSTVLDVYDRQAVLDAAQEVARTRPVLGVLSWDETLIVNTAHIAEHLGLPGATVDGIEGCRDKRRSRRVLSAAGLRQPRHGWAANEDAAVEVAAAVGYPAVVKPRGMGASIGVVLAHDEAELRNAFHTAENSSYDGAEAYHGGALVEEYLHGPEISVDGAVVAGTYLPMFTARKRVGMDPYFEELGHIVDAADPLHGDPELLMLLADAHRAIGFQYGITHTELKLTPDGPVIIEINGRLGGDLIPLLGKLATGIDPGVAVVDVATGRHPDLTHTRARTVGVRFGYPPVDCEVVSVEVPEVDEPRGVLAASALIDPGGELRLPPGGYIARHSYVICTAESPGACAALLDDVAAKVRFEWRELSSQPLTESLA